MKQEIEQMTAIYQVIVNFLVNYSFQIAGAIVTLMIGVLLAKKVSATIYNLCVKKNIDVTLSRFIASFIRILVIVMVAVMAVSKLGINITPFIATLGALSLGAGLAVQGLVSNYGAGLNIILTRPFVIGDTIEFKDVKGMVKDIHLGYTLLVDEDDVQIMIPNRHIIGEMLKNSQGDTLVEMEIGVSYGQSPQPAINIIRQVLDGSTLINQVRGSKVGINSFGDSAIVLLIRFWVQTEALHDTKFTINLDIYDALLAANITIPFPQHEVRVLDKKV